ncbi:MAG: hypothetical protein ABEJ31_06080 [Haloarculaceae archaeon]
MSTDDHRDGEGNRAGAGGRTGAVTDRYVDPGPRVPRRPRPLCCRVVEYPDAPDRVTLFPAGLSDVELMARWLSADAGDLVDLETAR